MHKDTCPTCRCNANKPVHYSTMLALGVSSMAVLLLGIVFAGPLFGRAMGEIAAMGDLAVYKAQAATQAGPGYNRNAEKVLTVREEVLFKVRTVALADTLRAAKSQRDAAKIINDLVGTSDVVSVRPLFILREPGGQRLTADQLQNYSPFDVFSALFVAKATKGMQSSVVTALTAKTDSFEYARANTIISPTQFNTNIYIASLNPQPPVNPRPPVTTPTITKPSPNLNNLQE